jgi:ribosomal protein S18 acetylase RimI-like enzyme
MDASKLTITIEDGRGAAAEEIQRGLVAWNLKVTGAREREAFTISVRSESGRVVGGLTAMVSYETLYIDDLWLAEDARGKDLGTRLMQLAENEGRRRGASLVWLDTMSWQARPFYEKLGYTVFGELEQSGGRYQRYFLKKAL